MFKQRLLVLFLIMFCLIPTVAADSEVIHLTVGDCKVFTVIGFTRVSTSNPEVIEVVVTSGQDILLNAKKPGLSVVNIWGEQGMFTYRVSVQEDYTNIEQEIKKLINNPNVSVIVNAKYVILNGSVSSSIENDQAIEYAKMYRENVISNLLIENNYQILLSIIVTEMKKEAQNKYGIRYGSWHLNEEQKYMWVDWSWLLGEKGENSFGRDSIDLLGAWLDAMQKDGDALILAAPTLLTANGKEATFLVGGEIPIPMADKDGITVEWKEYGIKLKVTSTIEKDNTILMDVAPEVSSLDWTNAVLVSGWRIPAIATRKTTTNVRFKNGSTIVIGGLLKREDSTNIFKLPVLGSLPIIGSLFRSKEFIKGDTELLFFVTPKIINDNSKIDPHAITTPQFQGPYYQPKSEAEPNEKLTETNKD